MRPLQARNVSAAQARELKEMISYLRRRVPVSVVGATSKMGWEWLLIESRGGLVELDVDGKTIGESYGAKPDAGRKLLLKLQQLGAFDGGAVDNDSGWWKVRVNDPRAREELRRIELAEDAGQAFFAYYLETVPEGGIDDLVGADQAAKALPVPKLSIAVGTSPEASSTGSPRAEKATPAVDGDRSDPSDVCPDGYPSGQTSDLPTSTSSARANKTSTSLTSSTSPPSSSGSEEEVRSAQPQRGRSSGQTSEGRTNVGPQSAHEVMLALADAIKDEEPDAQIVLHQELVDRIKRTVNAGDKLWDDVPNRIAWAVICGPVDGEELESLLRKVARKHKQEAEIRAGRLERSRDVGFRSGPSQYFNISAKNILAKHGILSERPNKPR